MTTNGNSDPLLDNVFSSVSLPPVKYAGGNALVTTTTTITETYESHEKVVKGNSPVTKNSIKDENGNVREKTVGKKGIKPLITTRSGAKISLKCVDGQNGHAGSKVSWKGGQLAKSENETAKVGQPIESGDVNGQGHHVHEEDTRKHIDETITQTRRISTSSESSTSTIQAHEKHNNKAKHDANSDTEPMNHGSTAVPVYSSQCIDLEQVFQVLPAVVPVHHSRNNSTHSHRSSITSQQKIGQNIGNVLPLKHDRELGELEHASRASTPHIYDQVPRNSHRASTSEQHSRSTSADYVVSNAGDDVQSRVLREIGWEYVEGEELIREDSIRKFDSYKSPLQSQGSHRGLKGAPPMLHGHQKHGIGQSIHGNIIGQELGNGNGTRVSDHVTLLAKPLSRSTQSLHRGQLQRKPDINISTLPHNRDVIINVINDLDYRLCGRHEIKNTKKHLKKVQIAEPKRNVELKLVEGRPPRKQPQRPLGPIRVQLEESAEGWNGVENGHTHVEHPVYQHKTKGVDYDELSSLEKALLKRRMLEDEHNDHILTLNHYGNKTNKRNEFRPRIYSSSKSSSRDAARKHVCCYGYEHDDVNYSAVGGYEEDSDSVYAEIEDIRGEVEETSIKPVSSLRRQFDPSDTEAVQRAAARTDFYNSHTDQVVRDFGSVHSLKSSPAVPPHRALVLTRREPETVCPLCELEAANDNDSVISFPTTVYDQITSRYAQVYSPIQE